MSPIQKKNAAIAFKQISAAYEKLALPATKEYYVTLGNSNEVHLIKKDAKKSVFLGRLVINSEGEMRKAITDIWEVLKSYFLKVPEEEVVEEIPEAVQVELEDFSNEVAGTKEEAPTPKKTTTRKRTPKKTTTDGDSGEDPMVVTPTVAEAPVVKEIHIEDDGGVADDDTEEAFNEWVDKIGD